VVKVTKKSTGTKQFNKNDGVYAYEFEMHQNKKKKEKCKRGSEFPFRFL
jgi:hypothetical protein